VMVKHIEMEKGREGGRERERERERESRHKQIILVPPTTHE